MLICTLKFVTSVIPEDTVSVSTAEVDCPAVRLVPALFQVIVIGPLAEVGFQFDVDILSVNVTVPVFLT